MQTLCLFGSVLLGFYPPVAWFGSLLTTLAPYLPWLLWSLFGLLAILWIIVVTVQRQRVVGSFQDAWRTRVSHAHLRRLTHVQGNLETHVDQAFGELGKHVWQEQLTHPDYLAHFEQLAALFQQRTRFRGELAGIDAETQQILAQMQQIKADYTAQITTVQAAQQAQSVRLEALATTRRGVEKQRGRLLEQHHKAQNELKSMHERLRTLERSGSTEQAAQTPVLRSGMAALEETLAGLTAQESQAQAQMATLQDEQIALTATLRQYEQQGAELQASQQQALAPLERVRDDLHQQRAQCNAAITACEAQISARLHELGREVYRLRPSHAVLEKSYAQLDRLQQQQTEHRHELDLTKARQTGLHPRAVHTAGLLLVAFVGTLGVGALVWTYRTDLMAATTMPTLSSWLDRPADQDSGTVARPTTEDIALTETAHALPTVVPPSSPSPEPRVPATPARLRAQQFFEVTPKELSDRLPAMNQDGLAVTAMRWNFGTNKIEVLFSEGSGLGEQILRDWPRSQVATALPAAQAEGYAVTNFVRVPENRYANEPVYFVILSKESGLYDQFMI
ncbi:MAG: hypothetical protein EOM24_16890, partial [Chloroflexia bacterium]|nr:hypothetical protein [Chloroflexia bacterium]